MNKFLVTKRDSLPLYRKSRVPLPQNNLTTQKRQKNEIINATENESKVAPETRNCFLEQFTLDLLDLLR